MRGPYYIHPDGGLVRYRMEEAGVTAERITEEQRALRERACLANPRVDGAPSTPATPSTPRFGDTYVAGSMRGNPQLGYALWEEVVPVLRKNPSMWGGVVSPHENFPADKSIPTEVCMAVDLQQVAQAKKIVMLPGWERSEGAKLELTVAIATGTDVYLARHGAHGWEFQFENDPHRLVQDISEEARSLVYGERNKDYGPPTKDFTRTGRIWGAILGLDEAVTPEQVALMMAALKISRLCESPDHYDSRVDTIGYMLTFDRVIRNV